SCGASPATATAAGSSSTPSANASDLERAGERDDPAVLVRHHGRGPQALAMTMPAAARHRVGTEQADGVAGREREQRLARRAAVPEDARPGEVHRQAADVIREEQGALVLGRLRQDLA